jgi:hypothetical protein
MKASVVGVVLLCCGAAASAAETEPALTDLNVARNGGALVASCRLAGGISPDVSEEIASGLETTVEYRLHVYRRRAGLPDEILAKRRVECSVRYDTLTRQYTLTRRLDGELVETQVTGDAAAMRDFLTTLRDVPVLETGALAPGREHYLKAKSNLGLMWRFYLIPWPRNTGWARVPIAFPQEKAVATEP